MATDAVVAGQPSLTRRASLNAAGSLLDYGAKIGVSFVVTPLLLTALGRTMFGVWEILGRLGSYMSATDGRPTEALRLILARHQAVDEGERNRRLTGAALTVWLCMVPLVLVAGGLVTWFAPALTRVSAAGVGAVRTACLLLVANFLLSGLAMVPEDVLRAMNLGYKRMGIQAGLNVLGGSLAAAAAWYGLGVAGLGGASLVRTAVTGLVFLALAARNVHWFGVARPTRADVRLLLNMSVWLSLGDLIAKVLLASDVVVLGAVVAPAVVTTYTLTGYAARMAVGMHVFAAGAAIPGLGGLLGRREFGRAAQARNELLTLTWLFVTAVGATILIWNRGFITLWVGAVNYAGPWVDLLIVLAAAQTAFIRVDAYLLDALLQPRGRVAVGAVAALLTFISCLALTRLFGLVGLCIGLLSARAVQTIAFPLMVRRGLATDDGVVGPLTVRMAFVSAAMFAAALALGRVASPMNAAWWSAGAVMTLLLCSALALLLGLDDSGRQVVLTRLRAFREPAGRP